jgi:hypothetical protein
MFATVVWLLWVLGLQTSVQGLAVALLGLLGLAMAAWLLGVLRSGTGRPALGLGATGLALLAVLLWTWPTDAPDTAAPGVAQATGLASNTGQAATAGLGNWQPYSDAALQAHLDSGKTVFVDFTAAWCVSCQVNKQLVLGRDDIGALAPGMAADLITVPLDEVGMAGALHDPVAALLLCHVPSVRHSVVNGQVRVRDGRLTGVDLPLLVQQHQDLARRLVNAS